MNKRGSHIDVIISFAIFIGILIFIYLIIQPAILNKPDKGTLVNNLEKEILNNISGNLTTISVSVADSTSACVNLKDFITTAGIGDSPHLASTSGTGSLYGVEVSDTDVYITRASAGQEFFKVYNSPQFPLTTTGQPGSCAEVPIGSGDESYSINQIKTDTYVLEKSALQLVSNIDADHSAAKDYFNISGFSNFGLSFIYQNKTSVGTTDKVPGASEVYSQSFPVVYVNKNASIESGSIIVKIW